MEFFRDIFHNQPLVTAGISWIIAAFLKVVIVWITSGNLDWEQLLAPGGMPSTHTTPVVACTTSIGLVNGWDSSLFAIGVVLSIIVAYDATGIRRQAGQQAQAINSLLSDLIAGKIFKEKHPADFFKKWNLHELETLLGHNPMEVFTGVLLGIAIAFLIHFNYGFLFPAIK